MNDLELGALLHHAGVATNRKHITVLGLFTAAPESHFSVEDIYSTQVPAGQRVNIIGTYRIIRRLHGAALLECVPGRLGSHGGKNMSDFRRLSGLRGFPFHGMTSHQHALGDRKLQHYGVLSYAPPRRGSLWWTHPDD